MTVGTSIKRKDRIGTKVGVTQVVYSLEKNEVLVTIIDGVIAEREILSFVDFDSVNENDFFDANDGSVSNLASIVVTRAISKSTIGPRRQTKVT